MTDPTIYRQLRLLSDLFYLFSFLTPYSISVVETFRGCIKILTSSGVRTFRDTYTRSFWTLQYFKNRDRLELQESYLLPIPSQHWTDRLVISNKVVYVSGEVVSDPLKDQSP